MERTPEAQARLASWHQLIGNLHKQFDDEALRSLLGQEPTLIKQPMPDGMSILDHVSEKLFQSSISIFPTTAVILHLQLLERLIEDYGANPLHPPLSIGYWSRLLKLFDLALAYPQPPVHEFDFGDQLQKLVQERLMAIIQHDLLESSTTCLVLQPNSNGENLLYLALKKKQLRMAITLLRSPHSSTLLEQKNARGGDFLSLLIESHFDSKDEPLLEKMIESIPTDWLEKQLPTELDTVQTWLMVCGERQLSLLLMHVKLELRKNWIAQVLPECPTPDWKNLFDCLPEDELPQLVTTQRYRFDEQDRAEDFVDLLCQYSATYCAEWVGFLELVKYLAERQQPIDALMQREYQGQTLQQKLILDFAASSEVLANILNATRSKGINLSYILLTYFLTTEICSLFPNKLTPLCHTIKGFLDLTISHLNWHYQLNEFDLIEVRDLFYMLKIGLTNRWMTAENMKQLWVIAGYHLTVHRYRNCEYLAVLKLSILWQQEHQLVNDASCSGYAADCDENEPKLNLIASIDQIKFLRNTLSIINYKCLNELLKYYGRRARLPSELQQMLVLLTPNPRERIFITDNPNPLVWEPSPLCDQFVDSEGQVQTRTKDRILNSAMR